MPSSLRLLLLLLPLLATTLCRCSPLERHDQNLFNAKLHSSRTKRNVQFYQLPATQLTLPPLGRLEFGYPTPAQPAQGQPGTSDYLNQYYTYAVIKGYGEEIGRRMALAQNVEKLKGSTVESFQRN